MFRANRQTIRLLFIGALAVFVLFFLESHAAQLPLGIHETADDASYLRPSENWYNTGIWKDNSIGASSYVQRPPLLGFLHLICYAISKTYAPILLFIISLCTHLIALSLLFKLLQEYSNLKKAFILASVYAMTPLFFGFLSYQITEAFAGSLMIIGIYLFTRKNYSLYYAIVFLILLYLFRPVLILAFLPALIGLLSFKQGKSKLNLKQYIVVSISFLALIGWELRKHHYTNDWLNPHPIYHASNQSQFRPVHQKLSNLFRIWETRPEVFHEMMGNCWNQSTINKYDLNLYCYQRNTPVSSNQLSIILLEYQKINQEVQENFLENRIITEETKQEIAFGKKTDSLTKALKNKHLFQYWVSTPIQGLKEQLFKSHLNLAIFQDYYRGTLWVESLRILCLLIVVLLYISVLFVAFTKNKWRFFALGALLYIFYLFWVQRMNEDRYLQPILCFSFVFAAVLIEKFSNFATKKRGA